MNKTRTAWTNMFKCERPSPSPSPHDYFYEEELVAAAGGIGGLASIIFYLYKKLVKTGRRAYDIIDGLVENGASQNEDRLIDI